MRKEQDDSIDPTRPALIVLYGATRRKFRPLEGDVVVLGRAPGCDIGLVSPEVAPVHCLLVRLGTGWRIRDCSGRATRVNGRAIHDEPLRNGDTIQVGTFSFEAQLPQAPPHVPAGVAGPVIDRLQRSRRRLAELALGLRRRLREEACQHEHDASELERHRADVELMERRLRQMHQDHVGKQAKVEEQEARLAQREGELEAYAGRLQAEADRLGRDAQDQLAQVEADLVAHRVEQNKEAERLSHWQHELQARQAELEATAAQVDELIGRERDQLDRDREQVAREREQLGRERQEVSLLRADLERTRDAITAQTPIPPTASRETRLEAGPGARLESARRLLRDLSERRRAEPTGKGSRSRQVRPPVQGSPE
ncbi:MAG: FHA domain-containing protein [Gemmataceae bacterium]